MGLSFTVWMLLPASNLQTQFISLPSDSSVGILRTLITMFCITKLASPLWSKDFLIDACNISPITLVALIWTVTTHITSLLDSTTGAFQSSSAKYPQLQALQVYSDFGYSGTAIIYKTFPNWTLSLFSEQFKAIITEHLTSVCKCFHFVLSKSKCFNSAYLCIPWHQCKWGKPQWFSRLK